MVYSKPLGGKSRIVKLVREMKKKIGSFTWAVLYMELSQGQIIQKPNKQELSALYKTHHLNVMHAL